MTMTPILSMWRAWRCALARAMGTSSDASSPPGVDTEPPDWSALTAARITTFVSQEAATRRNAGRKQPAVAVRSFLRFLVFRVAIRQGLEAAAPSPPQWKYASLPARLTASSAHRSARLCSGNSNIGAPASMVAPRAASPQCPGASSTTWPTVPACLAPRQRPTSAPPRVITAPCSSVNANAWPCARHHPRK